MSTYSPTNKGSNGKNFENDFKESCVKDGLFVHRLRDSAMSYTKIASVFTNNNPYDFLVFKFPMLFALELKHTKLSSITIQRTKDDDDKKMIKKHQIDGLLKASEHTGVCAGFIFSFYLEKTN